MLLPTRVESARRRGGCSQLVPEAPVRLTDMAFGTSSLSVHQPDGAEMHHTERHGPRLAEIRERTRQTTDRMIGWTAELCGPTGRRVCAESVLLGCFPGLQLW